MVCLQALLSRAMRRRPGRLQQQILESCQQEPPTGEPWYASPQPGDMVRPMPHTD